MHHKFITASVLIFCLLLLATSCTHTAKVQDEEGNTLALELHSKQRVSINGTKQTIYTAGTDKNNPILLWLDGGPGGSELAWVRKYLGPLHQDFTIVCWDQRGVAASFKAAKKGQSVEDYVLDVIALSEYLVKEHGQKKIFLLGHSWGGFIGALATQQRPDLYHAFIAASPHVNSTENDTIGYHMILDGAKKRGDTKTVAKLEAIGLPPYEKLDKKGNVIGDGDAYYAVLSRLYSYSPKALSDSGFRSEILFLAPEHSFFDRINLIKGLIQGVKEVYPQLRHRSLENEATQFDCPLVVVNATYDYSCVASITERWYSKAKAPSKHYLWLERSGHNGVYTQASMFIDFMVSEVLPLKN
ncbi:alpha/beta hydrolase [Sphaerochaeta globosa]|uniref:Alpha/beta hydrolase fold protein n=1 Tax=Sphaerochaeta globosa (strain ATCC BAA-1886 / DSM 22777 / Buddy) TaxID=158189 RepID=F0RT59_SPHGB|nr:alpha/beta hydrolase [Sphaerochaeta globosa]ADY14440.1 alpha/beta hydrolase fold protein [Sphaerochaeta globosa str. Buddy]